MSITDLSAYKASHAEPERTLEGKASCLQCKHTWHAVAPVGTVDLDCPACGSEKGLFAYQVKVEGYSWHCECGNDLFQLTPAGAVCVQCGDAHHYDDLQDD